MLRFTCRLSCCVAVLAVVSLHQARAEDAPAELAPLIAGLQSGDAAVQLTAINKLKAMGAKAAPAAKALTAVLCKAGAEPSKEAPHNLYETERALLAIGNAAVPIVAAAAQQPDLDQAATGRVIGTLARFEPDSSRQHIKQLLTSADIRIQILLLAELGQRRRHSQPFFAEITASLADSKHTAVRFAAANALEKIAQYARQPAQVKFSQQAAKLLIGLSEDEDTGLALAAIGALVRIEDGRHDNGNLAAIAPRLISLLQNKDDDLRLQAAKYLKLSELATDNVVDALITAMKTDAEPKVRMTAAEALNRNAYRQTKVIAAMAQVIADIETPAVRPRGFHMRPVATAASLTLYNNHKASLPFLQANLSSKNADARYVSAHLIAQIQPKFEAARVRGIFASRLDHQDPMVRYNAATDLGRLGALAAPVLPQLVKLLSDHTVATPSPQQMYISYVHDAAARTLGLIGAGAQSAAAPLAAVITGGEVTNPHSLRNVFTALKKVDPQHPLTAESFVLDEAASTFSYYVTGAYTHDTKTAGGTQTVRIEFPQFEKQSGYITKSPLVITTKTANGQATQTRQRRLQLHQQGATVLLTETISDQQGQQISKTTAVVDHRRYGVSLSVPPADVQKAKPGDWIAWSWEPIKIGGVRGYQQRKGVKETAIWNSVRK